MWDYIKELGIDWWAIATFLSIFLGAFILSRLVRWFINKSYLKATRKFKADLTRIKFFKNAASLIIWMVALGVFVSMIPSLKSLAITLFAGAGILLAILGFAAQEAFSNIISGIFIIVFRPFRVGDMIKVGNQNYGIVEDITLRHTVLLNFENKRIILPNSVVSSEIIINDSIEDKVVCRFIEIGISYDSNVELATKIIQEVAVAHPKSIDHRTNAEKKQGFHQVEVRLIEFSDSSVKLRAYVWTDDPINALRTHSDINKEVKRRFQEEGVEIPYPYRTVVYKTDLPTNV